MSEQLRATVAEAVRDLDAEHAPMWVARDLHGLKRGYTQEPQKDRDPVGCAACYPADSSWPCSSRMVADDLRAALVEHGETA